MKYQSFNILGFRFWIPLIVLLVASGCVVGEQKPVPGSDITPVIEFPGAVVDLPTPTQTPSLPVNTWTFLGLDKVQDWAISINSVEIDPSSPDTIYAGTDWHGVYKSSDGGMNWSSISSGLVKLNVRTLVIDPKTPSTLYLGTDGNGVYKTTDSGGTWQSINHGLEDTGIETLLIDAQNPAILYVGTQKSGVFKSLDAGETWNVANNGIQDVIISSLAFEPGSSTILYAGTGGIAKSIDAGLSWVHLYRTNILFQILVADPAAPGLFYAGTSGVVSELGGVYKSTDGGSMWSRMTEGLPDGTVFALAIDPLDSQIIYAGTYGSGVYRSLDGGENWKKFNKGMKDAYVLVLTFDPSNPSILYAGTAGQGLFVIQTHE